MNAKTAMYAAVGAPIVAARAINTRWENLREELDSRGDGLTERAQHLLEEWSREGRQAVAKVSDGKMVDEFTSKVDFDQAREQVGKLRDQLEEMLATWRTSFRPETAGEAPGASSEAEPVRAEQAEPVEGTDQPETVLAVGPVDEEAALPAEPQLSEEWAEEAATESDDSGPDGDHQA